MTQPRVARLPLRLRLRRRLILLFLRRDLLRLRRRLLRRMVLRVLGRLRSPLYFIRSLPRSIRSGHILFLNRIRGFPR